MRASINCTFTRTLSPAFCTAPSRTVETPSSCATLFKLSGLLWYPAVEVREITLRSRTVANFVRISSFMPSAKYALSGSWLRFSKGRTAMLFSGTEGVVFLGGVAWNTRTATIVVRATKAAPTANRAAILRRLVIEVRIACNFAPSECGPAGRAAGSISNIEINNEMKRRGTCAAFS